jgi:Pol polyprotein, beta-barrel domain/gag-polypeptide of LTR copia-type
MEAYLTEKGYAIAMIEPNFPEDTDLATIEAYRREQEDKSPKAAAIIRLFLEDGPLIQVKGITKAIEIWDRLKALYEPKGFSSEFLLCRELFDTTLVRTGNSIEAYLTRIKRLTDELAARGLTIPNKVIAAYALNNLTPDYENTVAIISQSFRTSTTDIDIIQLFSQLIDEARRLKAKEPQEMAMASKDTRPYCSHCNKSGHSIENCWKKHPNLRPKRNKAKEKPKNNSKDESKEDKTKSSETTLITEDKDSEWALSLSEKTSKDTWLLDSGTTKHVCAYKDLFVDLRPYKTTLKWGSASTIEVNWLGKVRVRFTSTGQTAILDDCLYVPEIGLNLLSLGQIASKGISINIGPNYCELSKGSLIAKGLYRNNLTLFETETENAEFASIANIAQTNDNIWHFRMGHIGNNALNALPTRTIGVEGPIEGVKECETCIQAKATANISRTPMSKASEILEKVHSDICGPISPGTFRKKRYFVSFIDDKTRYAEIRLLNTRDEVFNEFNDWLIEEKKQLGDKLKRLHSDNAKEYKTEEFKSLFKE